MLREEAYKIFDERMQEVTADYKQREDELKWQIKELELEIEVLKKDNERIWQMAIDKISEVRVGVKE